MAYKNDDYSPNAKSRALLERAWQHVSSIPYRATSRWLFYRLLQDGFYKGKDDNKKFISLMSRVRHNNYGPWRPDSLSDDTRHPIPHPAGYEDVEDWAESLRQETRIPPLDHWYYQDFYVEVWYEAEAMTPQFEYYCEGVTLRPFKGMPSIDYKFKIAKELEGYAEQYKLPIMILYFGDYDKAGLFIPETSVKDIRGWCGAEFEFIRCGLNEGDSERLGIPENFEHPGSYQWEALPDEAARQLIVSSLQKYVDQSIIEDLKLEAQGAGAKLKEALKNFAL